jgi:hypothetical protein
MITHYELVVGGAVALKRAQQNRLWGTVWKVPEVDSAAYNIKTARTGIFVVESDGHEELSAKAGCAYSIDIINMAGLSVQETVGDGKFPEFAAVRTSCVAAGHANFDEIVRALTIPVEFRNMERQLAEVVISYENTVAPQRELCGGRIHHLKVDPEMVGAVAVAVTGLHLYGGYFTGFLTAWRSHEFRDSAAVGVIVDTDLQNVVVVAACREVRDG